MGSYKLTKSLFYLYFAAIVWIILFKMQMPFANMGQIRSISLIPFAGSVKVNGQIYIPKIVENVLIFIPFGIFSGMSGQSKTWLRRLAPSFFTSLALEILQLILAAGVSDMTDLLANTTGGWIGLGIFSVFSRLCREKVNVVLNIIMLTGASGMILLTGMLILANR